MKKILITTLMWLAFVLGAQAFDVLTNGAALLTQRKFTTFGQTNGYVWPPEQGTNACIWFDGNDPERQMKRLDFSPTDFLVSASNLFVNPSIFASPSQGAKADSAIQPSSLVSSNYASASSLTNATNTIYGLLGSAAFTPVSDYASSAQGALGSTAVQPASLISATNTLYLQLGSAAFLPSSTFASAAEGLLAQSAIQPSALASSNYVGVSRLNSSNYVSLAQLQSSNYLTSIALGSSTNALYASITNQIQSSNYATANTLTNATNAIYGSLAGTIALASTAVQPQNLVQPDWTQTNTASLSYIQNKPDASVTNTTRTFNSSFQPNTNRACRVDYSVRIAATITLTTGQTGTVFLEVSADNATWVEMTRSENVNTGSLTIGLNLTQTVSGQIGTVVPRGYYVRLRTSGTATITYIGGQEYTL